jgi:hypothetical protein
MELESSATTVLRQQVAEGLLYAHSRLNGNTSKTLEATAFLYALVELLAERGLITIDELDARKAVVTERLAAQLTREGQGAMLQDPEYDKYAFEGEAEIDCAERLELCRAYDCRRESRIWLDFDSRRVNPAILEPGWPRAPEDEGAAP